jgi:hypothetical protein
MHKGIMTLAIAVLAATVAIAQAKPDFSGTWTLDLDRSEMGGTAGGDRPGRGQGAPLDAKFIVKQTASELSIDQQAGGTSNVTTFKLDGSESVNTGMRGGEVTSKARWDGNRLIIESTQAMNTPGGGMTLETKEVRSLAPDGTMVVERMTVTPRGTRTQKLVFKRTT